jgi:hypothetical protein
VPHRAHWQPLEYNALHGGIERWFEPLAPALARRGLGPAAGRAGGAAPARCAAARWLSRRTLPHRHRSEGIGRPTPEGAHRDGVDMVAVILVARPTSRAARRASSTPAARRACASR